MCLYILRGMKVTFIKNIAFILIAFSLFSCADTPKERPVEKTKEVRVSKFQQLLTKYKDISFDTLEVFAAFDMDKKSYKYSGVELDSTEMMLLPEGLGSLEPHSFFACYKFTIDSASIGLITRVPGEYSPTSIKLLVLDTKLDSVVSYFELSDLSGDAGDMWQKTSWLYKNENSYRSLLWQELTHDHIVDDEADSTVDRTNNYYLIDFSSLKPDTIVRDTMKLTMQFADLLKKRTPNE